MQGKSRTQGRTFPVCRILCGGNDLHEDIIVANLGDLDLLDGYRWALEHIPAS